MHCRLQTGFYEIWNQTFWFCDTKLWSNNILNINLYHSWTKKKACSDPYWIVWVSTHGGLNRNKIKTNHHDKFIKISYLWIVKSSTISFLERIFTVFANKNFELKNRYVFLKYKYDQKSHISVVLIVYFIDIIKARFSSRYKLQINPLSNKCFP